MFKPVFGNPLEHVVAHSPADSKIYLGSPSLALARNGHIIASHDFFGPCSPRDGHHREFLSRIYRSEDGGVTWMLVTEIKRAFWSSLFAHRGQHFLLGCSAHDGDIVIRRSTDGGLTWTDPVDDRRGLLFPGGDGTQPPNYHCAPVPILEHRGRIWRAFEDNMAGRWPGFHAAVISADAGSDLVRASSWRMTNKLPYDREADPPEFNPRGAGWLEGNVVATPDDEIWNILRVHSVPLANKAALTKVSANGRALSFDLRTGFVDLPGGMSKFNIRYDERTQRYWMISNEVFVPRNPWQRNVLVLSCSEDLLSWHRCAVLLYAYQDERRIGKACKIGFQYPDWIFDDNDMLILVRTAFNGAHNFHDANYITFHRLHDYERFL